MNTSEKKVYKTRKPAPGHSLADVNPDLAAQWDADANDGLSARDVFASSRFMAGWHDTSCGHRWRAVIDNRHRRGVGCPVCRGKIVVAGSNDLATTHPRVAALWHPSRNGDLTPQDVTAGKALYVWWLSADGVAFERSIGNMVSSVSATTGAFNLHNKPIYVPTSGFGRYLMRHPALARQWDVNRNETPLNQVTVGQKLTAWWTCPICAGQWQADVRDRYLSTHIGCRSCTTKVLSAERAARAKSAA